MRERHSSEYVQGSFNFTKEHELEPYQAHSDTSRDAAEAIAGKANTLRRLVYEFIKECGSHGATDIECQRELGLDGSTQRPRRVRLVQLGLIEDSGETRSSPSGRQSVVWRATT